MLRLHGWETRPTRTATGGGYSIKAPVSRTQPSKYRVSSDRREIQSRLWIFVEHVMSPMIYADVSRAQRIEQATEALAQVSLMDRLQNRPNQLSGLVK